MTTLTNSKRRTSGIIAPEVRDGKTKKPDTTAVGQNCSKKTGNNASAVEVGVQKMNEVGPLNQKGDDLAERPNDPS